jgi:hypothetical protein
VVERFLPAENTEAPLIAGLKSREGKLGARSHEVISLVPAELQKLLRHHRANAMESAIACTGPATAVTKEAGHGIGRAGGEVFPENIQVCHAENLDLASASGKSQASFGCEAGET